MQKSEFQKCGIVPGFANRVTYNVRVLNNSQLVVVLMGRLMHGVMSIVPWCLKYKIGAKEK